MFKASNLPRVVQYMEEQWVPYASKWALWGRLEGRDLRMDTNNPAEAQFRVIKYGDFNRHAQSTIHQLITKLVGKVVVRHMMRRAQQLVGRASSSHVQIAKRTEAWVEKLVTKGRVRPTPGDTAGCAEVDQSDGPVQVCLGDLSCQCGYSGEWGGGGVKRVLPA